MRLKVMTGCLLLSIAACSKKETPKAQQLVPEVTAVKTSVRDIPITKEFVGQISGIRDIQVRARVGGILLKRYYTEGDKVKAGSLLFKIDPAPYTAALNQAKGEVAIQKARLTNARQSMNRIIPLYKENAVSQKDRDDAVAVYNAAKSALDAATANMEQAQINLGYTTVTAPIDGYTSKETVAEGSLIVANSENSLLTTISQTDPAYVNFSYTDNELLELRRLAAKGKLIRPDSLDKIEVQVRMGDGELYPQIGFMNFNDQIVDTSTGTVKARASIANKDAVLRPGQFVSVYVKGFMLRKVITVPLKSIVQTQNGPIIFSITENSVARQISVELGEEIINDVVVNRGLRGGELIVVEGASKIRNGQTVKVVSGTSIAKK
ncbi:efflux RND transporter periplasmic adaptor subunit [Bdellovibrio sp. KM01]|uniref:efflux RND transporter periplasmic adaptor subunit n=1 Tax=Bdellovibrio sp. KM01 TaxID=2748865 RepID=UPI0015EAA81E|nr:efflux RND transporter periplasmic adaptor subunit [Bdellovibrio sp. KM01]QLY24711.1 efflux RND transporter periplasmic adaptor subunit [Bdellovibrio sp. KM01]